MYGLDNDDIMRMQSVFSAHKEVREVWLYGSRAKGNYRADSDIDLTLLGDQDRLSLSVLFEIENELDDLLLPYTIDVSIFHRIENPDVVAHIKRVGNVFYAREHAVTTEKSAFQPSA